MHYTRTNIFQSPPQFPLTPTKLRMQLSHKLLAQLSRSGHHLSPSSPSNAKTTISYTHKLTKSKSKSKLSQETTTKRQSNSQPRIKKLSTNQQSLKNVTIRIKKSHTKRISKPRNVVFPSNIPLPCSPAPGPYQAFPSPLPCYSHHKPSQPRSTRQTETIKQSIIQTNNQTAIANLSSPFLPPHSPRDGPSTHFHTLPQQQQKKSRFQSIVNIKIKPN